MKKNITINLFGTLYAIDEDACQLLEQYTENMRSYFAKQDGGDEIVDDIEHRIAELLWENKEQGHEAVDIQTIKNIINKIGDVEQMGAGTTQTDSGNNRTNGAEQTLDDNPANSSSAGGKNSTGIYGNQETSGSRKLYRNGNNKMLGGVLSGLSQYCGGKDPLPWRIGFVILFFVCLAVIGPFHPFNQIIGLMAYPYDVTPNMMGMVQEMTSGMLSPYNFIIRLLRWSPIIAYIALWALVPEAKTVEDRLKMQGKRVDPNNIKKEVIIEHEQKCQPEQKKGCADGCLSIFVFAGKILGLGCLGCLGSILLICLFSLLFGWGITHVNWSISGLQNFFINHTNLTSCGAPNLTFEYDLNSTPFTEIDFDGVGTLKFTQGDTFRFVADGDSCHVCNLQFRVENGCLHIDDSEFGKDDPNRDRTIHGKTEFIVTAPSLSYLHHKGVGDICMPDSIHQDTDMIIDYDGVGSADITYISCPTLTFERGGVGDVHMRMDNKHFMVRHTGVGDMYLGGHTKQYEELQVSEFTSKIYHDELEVE